RPDARSSLIRPPPPTSTLFPYTTLFRSRGCQSEGDFPHAASACCQILGRVCDRSSPATPGPRVAEVLVGQQLAAGQRHRVLETRDRKSTRLNSSHVAISYAVFCLKKKTE